MTIFLTGATGFLGGQLVKNVLQETTHSLYVLARNKKKAKQLLQSIRQEDQQRITIIYGDIQNQHFGLSTEEISRLINKVTYFYHLAALVKFDETLRDELFSINYDGTKHALEFATTIHAKKFFYVSTAYTIGKRSHGIEELYPIDRDVHNPYEESKIQSEHLVFSYKDKLDVSIFRPSIIVGHSKTGEADSNFTLYGFMRALDVFKRKMHRSDVDSTKVYRLIGNKQSTSNFVPVDYVADILLLALQRAKPNAIYHITNPQAVTNFTILQLIKEALQFHQLEIIDETTKRSSLPVEDQQLNELIDVFNVYLSRDFHFEDSNTQQLIQHSNVTHLQLPEKTLAMIIQSYERL